MIPCLVVRQEAFGSDR